MRSRPRTLFPLLTLASVLSGQGAAAAVSPPACCVSNAAQFGSLPNTIFLGECDFHLTGLVTLADTNRELVVLQDATGAVALNYPGAARKLQVGRLATLEGTNCCPLFARFPDYPYRPAGGEICSSFEAPRNWGEYNLTRMRGYLHPQVTGDYRFWIASDNSSELWLSRDATPTNARKIASLPRFGWTDPNQWTKYPSQHSDLIPLKGGETYYIEALQEQTGAGENLSVAWQEPAPTNPEIHIIEGQHLTPWQERHDLPTAATMGILREYWTNFFSGDVEGMTGARAYEAALTIREMSMTVGGPGEWPTPQPIAWDQPLLAKDNYRWMLATGLVKFASAEGGQPALEVFDGQSLILVRCLEWNREKLKQWRRLTNAVVQVQGVCEAVVNRVSNQPGPSLPGCLWASADNSLALVAAGSPNAFAPAETRLARSAINPATTAQGYFGTLGVVTFNDHVFDKDYIFVQQDTSAWQIALENNALRSEFRLGHYVDLGGALEPGSTPQTISPLFVTELGLHPMPSAMVPPAGLPAEASQAGRWCEFEGVVRAVNSNGTLSLAARNGAAFLWLGQTPANCRSNYVDAELRARGVLLPSLLNVPTLLVPSRDFLEVVEEPPPNPFGISRCPIARVFSPEAVPPSKHRVRVTGEITYQDANSFFIQDPSGGIRVQISNLPQEKVGETADVVAFPMLAGATRILTEPLLRPANADEQISPISLDSSEPLSFRLNGALVQVSATLLGQKTNGMTQVLELQEQQRVFVATLANRRDRLPTLFPGSRLRVIGVCDDPTPVLPVAGGTRAQFLAPLNLLLRRPQDVTLLSGPPWWTWQKTATLVGMLITISAVALLWVHLLRRRLVRQKAAQLAFSRHVLGKLEEERRRIAINLHDSLGQTLHVIKNHADLATQSPGETQTVNSRLDEISGIASHAIEEVRRITHGLRPYQLDRLGLTQAIRTLIAQAAENRQISFACRIEEIGGIFDKEAEIHFYRIVQEAVTNVIKHSAATEAIVVIKKRAAAISFSLRDNGKGFEPAKLASGAHGFGLTGLNERVRILKGTLTVDSKTGAGTCLMAEIPF